MVELPEGGFGMQRVKRLMLLSVFVGSIGIVGAFPALAGPPVGSCPDNNANANQWERVTVQSLIDAGLIVSAGGVDQNGNGLTCVVFPPGQGQVGIPTIRDDTVGPHSS